VKAEVGTGEEGDQKLDGGEPSQHGHLTEQKLPGEYGSKVK
jgi:hypothetical protein